MATRSQKRVSTLTSVPSPNKGLNAVDSLAAMDPNFCIYLRNWLPGATALRTLQGTREHCTGLDGSVRTLVPYARLDGETNIFAATDTAMWNVTDSSASPLPVYGISMGRVDYTQLANVAANYLIFANGVDDMFMWNGSSWITFTTSGSPTNPGEISGVDPADISLVLTYKRRLWMVEKASMTAWYLPTDSVAGVATPFYLGGVFTRGGYIVDILSWSFNSGAGLNGYLVFRSSTGEVAVYQGDDPDDATTWSLVSLYFVAPSIGERASTDLGGDSLLLTSAGIIPLSKVVQGAATEALFESTVSRYINPIIADIYSSSAFTPNWEVHNLASLQGILLAIPGTNSTPARQYFMNTVTGAWAELDMDARCFTVVGARVFFGDDEGRVWEYGTTGLRGVKLDGIGGAPVDCYLFSAYNYFGDTGSLKHYKMIRPIFQADSDVYFRLLVSTDFDVNNPSNVIPAVSGSASTDRWDSALWDVAIWRAALTVSRPWSSVSGIGMCAALVMRVASDNDIAFAAADWVYERGTSV